MSLLFNFKHAITVIPFISSHFLVYAATQWIQYPNSGIATMTHYTLPEDYIASCGCTAQSTHYPTAALNQMAFGSSTSYGPACGRCFKLTLLNTFLSNPPFYPTVTKSVVIKITDLCPLSKTGWCNGTVDGPNSAGNYLNFDLAFPSSSIPSDFFPSNETLYGYTDLVSGISVTTASPVRPIGQASRMLRHSGAFLVWRTGPAVLLIQQEASTTHVPHFLIRTVNPLIPQAAAQ